MAPSPPRSSVTVSRTWYVPADPKVWDGLRWVDEPPSPKSHRQAVTLPSVSLLPSENRQPAASQTGVKAALGGAFVVGAPPANCAVAGFEQMVVAASHTLKM